MMESTGFYSSYERCSFLGLFVKRLRTRPRQARSGRCSLTTTFASKINMLYGKREFINVQDVRPGLQLSGSLECILKTVLYAGNGKPQTGIRLHGPREV